MLTVLQSVRTVFFNVFVHQSLYPRDYINLTALLFRSYQSSES